MSDLLAALGVVLTAVFAYAMMNPDQRSDTGSYLMRLWCLMTACLCGFYLTSFVRGTGEVSRPELLMVIINTFGVIAAPIFLLAEIATHRRAKLARQHERDLKAAVEKFQPPRAEPAERKADQAQA